MLARYEASGDPVSMWGGSIAEPVFRIRLRVSA